MMRSATEQPPLWSLLTRSEAGKAMLEQGINQTVIARDIGWGWKKHSRSSKAFALKVTQQAENTVKNR